MSSCSEAFIDLRPCAILVVGVAGTMPIHGIGTALFLLTLGDREVLLRIHNCLLCHGEDSFNLLSVSQMLQSGNISVLFKENKASIEVVQGGISTNLPLKAIDGLYELRVRPISLSDRRIHHLKRYDLTCDDDLAAAGGTRYVFSFLLQGVSPFDRSNVLINLSLPPPIKRMDKFAISETFDTWYVFRSCLGIVGGK
jgi:hypothetical protein